MIVQNINPIKKKQLGPASPVGTLLYQWLVLGGDGAVVAGYCNFFKKLYFL